jgi:DNA-binding CsgD family transcriptional regulator
LHGEPGIGKSALLEYLVNHAGGCRIVRAIGVQSEMELAFAGLHQVCAPLLSGIERLPAPQREALSTALGLAIGVPPDRFLVALAALGLLSDAAPAEPLICVVDDAHWLDRTSLQVLAFVARRLAAESVAIAFAIRDPDEVPELAGLRDLPVHGLGEEDARALLDIAQRGPVDSRVVDQILAEARGNPLALLEFPKGFSRTQIVGGFGPPGVSGLPTLIEAGYQRQLAELPADTRELLLVAAAEPTGDPVLMWRAAERLGVNLTAAASAEAAGLVEFGARVRFRHPLFRSAVYRAATVEQLGRTHAALAEATDPAVDPDRRAWHRAQAAPGPDEAVAAELERSSARAAARGGQAAAAAFLARAVQLTAEAPRRAERALAAAEVQHEAGAADAALRLLCVAEATGLTDLGRAQADLLRAQIAFTTSRGSDAPALLLKAARQLERFDVRLCRDTYLDALLASMFAGALAAAGGNVREVAEAARSAPPAVERSQPADLLLDGLAVRFTDGYAAAVPVLRGALAAFRDIDLTPDLLRWFWLAHIMAGHLWDEQTLDNGRHLQVARDVGALATLPLALSVRIGAHVLAGELGAAHNLMSELETVEDATGIPSAPYGALLLAAWRGREADALTLIEKASSEALRRGEGFGLTTTGIATALLYNSLGSYEDAADAATKASEYPPAMGVESWGVLVELVEAAVGCGRRASAADAFARIIETTQATRTAWALGIEARCRALLDDAASAEIAYREAIEQLSATRIRGELARAHLLFGEWLRRQKRPGDARQQLSIAHEMFTTMGMEAFSERSAAELRATGATVRRSGPATASRLTAQEAQVARLAAGGLSNAEIASRLFISPRTVEWHLSRVFTKLQITSRRQLRQ